MDVFSDLKKGDRAVVLGIDLNDSQKQRLLEMGMTVGMEFELVRFAPLGDPIEIKVRGYHLSLRKTDAAGIRIRKL